MATPGARLGDDLDRPRRRSTDRGRERTRNRGQHNNTLYPS